MASLSETDHTRETYSDRELMAIAAEANLLYAKSILYKHNPLRQKKDYPLSLREMVLRGMGRKKIGEVEGRPDDEEIEIDKVGEDVNKGIIEMYKYPISVRSEHRDYGLENAEMDEAQDPFDNSSQYKRGLPTPVFSVKSQYSRDNNRNPIGGVSVDIKEAKVTLASDGGVYVIDNFLEGTPPRRAYKSNKTTIKDPEITIASYTGSPEYGLEFYSNFNEDEGKFKINFGKMIKDMDRKGRIYADGGAFIYALLAEGRVDAYVMKNEPLSEIGPGAALAILAGCTLWCVGKDGKIEDYRYDPERFHGEVPLFIAAGTPELAKEIYDYYFRYKDEILVAA